MENDLNTLFNSVNNNMTNIIYKIEELQKENLLLKKELKEIKEHINSFILSP